MSEWQCCSGPPLPATCPWRCKGHKGTERVLSSKFTWGFVFPILKHCLLNYWHLIFVEGATLDGPEIPVFYLHVEKATRVVALPAHHRDSIINVLQTKAVTSPPLIQPQSQRGAESSLETEALLWFGDGPEHTPAEVVQPPPACIIHRAPSFPPRNPADLSPPPNSLAKGLLRPWCFFCEHSQRSTCSKQCPGGIAKTMWLPGLERQAHQLSQTEAGKRLPGAAIEWSLWWLRAHPLEADSLDVKSAIYQPCVLGQVASSLRLCVLISKGDDYNITDLVRWRIMQLQLGEPREQVTPGIKILKCSFDSSLCLPDRCLFPHPHPCFSAGSTPSMCCLIPSLSNSCSKTLASRRKWPRMVLFTIYRNLKLAKNTYEEHSFRSQPKRLVDTEVGTGLPRAVNSWCSGICLLCLCVEGHPDCQTLLWKEKNVDP